MIISRDTRVRSLEDVEGGGWSCVPCGRPVRLWEPYRFPTGCLVCERCARLPINQFKALLLDHLLERDDWPQVHIDICCHCIRDETFGVDLSGATRITQADIDAEWGATPAFDSEDA